MDPPSAEDWLNAVNHWFFPLTVEWWLRWLKESGFCLSPLCCKDSSEKSSHLLSQPITSLLLFSLFPLPLSLPLSLSLLTNGINRPWNNQCWWSILEPVDMLMSTPHRYCCRVINHCFLPECTAAGAANPRPGIKHCLLTINVQTFCCPVPWLFSDAKKVGRIVNQ